MVPGEVLLLEAPSLQHGHGQGIPITSMAVVLAVGAS